MSLDAAQPHRDPADHGGGLDAARRRFGGARSDWIDLSTGINPVPFPLPDLPADCWTALPDQGAQDDLLAAARLFWRVPDGAAIVAAPGTSALIAQLPGTVPAGRVRIPGPTYNEHARAFAAHHWAESSGAAEALVLVNPNNPDGRVWTGTDAEAGFVVIDESFADVAPAVSLVRLAARPGTVVLKGLGKFWGLAGLRLGFAIGDPALIRRLSVLLGPWAVSGPALAAGTAALRDDAWAAAARARLVRDAARLDALLTAAGAEIAGGTDLFRLVRLSNPRLWHMALARRHIWTRMFPYSTEWLRLGLPGSEVQWSRLAKALEDLS
ncbi:MAG: pyridoxal phosphate-dependent class II aminotransferase [Rhodobacter sp.]|nr:pyridoxal phosphate-dependent class II aminotransferase [Rhodobacter sp.]